MLIFVSVVEEALRNSSYPQTSVYFQRRLGSYTPQPEPRMPVARHPPRAVPPKAASYPESPLAGVSQGSTKKFASAEINIPTITADYLLVQMIQPTQLADLGPGGETFKRALASWNASKHDDAECLYEQAISEGLTSLPEGATRSNLAQILLKRKHLLEAIEHFLAILRLKTATYDSVNDAAQYLQLILVEVGRSEEAHALQALAAKAQAQLGYSLRDDAKESVRRQVRDRLRQEKQKLAQSSLGPGVDVPKMHNSGQQAASTGCSKCGRALERMCRCPR